MKVPLQYPKIPDSTGCPLKKCVVFEKYDGTNLHWQWNRDFGWHSFGTRRSSYPLDNSGITAFNEEHPGLEEALNLFHKNFSLQVEEILMEDCARSEVKIFTEFFGMASFAGQHQPNDPKQLIMFDVLIDGPIFRDYFVPPEPFIDRFKDLDIAQVLYKGKYSGQLVEDIRKGKFHVNEGAVIKGTVGEYEDRQRVAVKVKTDSYMERLQLAFKDNWQDYWE